MTENTDYVAMALDQVDATAKLDVVGWAPLAASRAQTYALLALVEQVKRVADLLNVR